MFASSTSTLALDLASFTPPLLEISDQFFFACASGCDQGIKLFTGPA